MSYLFRSFALMLPLLAFGAPAHAAKYIFKAAEGDAIVAEPQKPDVAVFITRKNLNKAYDFEFKYSFIPLIIEAANKAPF